MPILPEWGGVAGTLYLLLQCIQWVFLLLLQGNIVSGQFKFHGIITTFEMIMADCPELKKINWRCVVIDEAHRLKNRNCKLLEGLKLMNLVIFLLICGPWNIHRHFCHGMYMSCFIYNINCSTNDSKSSGLNAEKGKWSHLWAKLQCYLLCTHLIYLPTSASLHLHTHILSGHRMSNLISLTLHITAAMATVCKLDAVLFFSRK